MVRLSCGTRVWQSPAGFTAAKALLLLGCTGPRPRKPPPSARARSGARARACVHVSLGACVQGLGKTMQCSAFVAGLLASGLATSVLVIAPKTLLPHW
jgi:hypothetical protein